MCVGVSTVGLMALLIFAQGEMGRVQDWMQSAFYPVLFTILVAASLGVPIPEDIPLLAAGVLLRTHPGIASWPVTMAVALVGIISGDLILYWLGRRWGPNVVTHRWICWMITPQRFARFSQRFGVHGTWFCFFGRFVVGVRAAMCLTAGATRFPYWRFFLADFAGALLSIPLFLALGYWFAGMLPTIQKLVGEVQLTLLAFVTVTLIVLMIVYHRRRRRHHSMPRTISVVPPTGSIGGTPLTTINPAGGDYAKSAVKSSAARNTDFLAKSEHVPR